MRNKLIHEYFGVDRDMLWLVVSEELPAIRHDIQVLSQKNGS